jgi:SAM-dependent methyltransferase
MANSATWDERYAARELVWSAGPNRQFADEIASLTPGTALDVACGEGRNAIYLAEQGWKVTAVDFSEVGIDKGKRIAVSRGVEVEWIVGDVSIAPLPEQAFDLVAILYLHTDPGQRERWLSRAVAAVAPGGTFVYIGHDPTNIEGGVGGPQDPAVLPDKEEILGYLSGFEVDRAEVMNRPVDNEPGHGKQLQGVALDTVVRAHRTTAE